MKGLTQLSFISLTRALEYREQKEAKKPRLALKKGNIIGESPAIKQCLDLMARAARNPRVVAKLSGLYRHGGPPAAIDDLRPWIADALELFGPDRLLWGSDWPVCLLAAGYREWIQAARELLSPLPKADRDKIFGLNAARFYGLKGYLR